VQRRSRGYGNNPTVGSEPIFCWHTTGANPQATLRSYELIAREVMPKFQGHAQATLDAARRAKEAREGLAADSHKQSKTHGRAIRRKWPGVAKLL
jgi:hypothetical protein